MAQTLLDAKLPHELLGVGNIMCWSGFAWAALTAFLNPHQFSGLGICFALLFVLIIPGANVVDMVVVIDTWAYMLWGIVCLIILVMVLAGTLRENL